MSYDYPISFITKGNNCLCQNGEIEDIPDVFLSICRTCFRKYYQAGDNYLLLIPWQGFNAPKVTGTQPCPVCHGFTDFEAPESRYTCKEQLCGYSWFQKNMGRGRSVARLTNRKDYLLKKWADHATAKEQGEIIVEIQTIQDKIILLESSYWVIDGPNR